MGRGGGISLYTNGHLIFHAAKELNTIQSCLLYLTHLIPHTYTFGLSIAVSRIVSIWLFLQLFSNFLSSVYRKAISVEYKSYKSTELKTLE